VTNPVKIPILFLQGKAGIREVKSYRGISLKTKRNTKLKV